MKRAKRTIVLIGLALVSCRGPTVAPLATPQIFEVRIAATTATFSLVEDLAAAYAHPGIVLALDSIQADWDTIYGWLRTGELSFALTTYLPSDAGLWAASIGQDGIAVITHADNPVPALSLADLRLIFEGRIANWREVGGPDLPVTVICREDGADTAYAFRALVMGDRSITLAAQVALSSRSMVERVAALPGAVGYVSLAQLVAPSAAPPVAPPVAPSPGAPSASLLPVRVIPLAARPGDAPVSPTSATIRAAMYPLRTPVLIVGREPPTPGSLYYGWFAWMQSPAGQEIVERHTSTIQS